MSSNCRLEVNTLDGRKFLFENVPVDKTSIDDVFGMVKKVEDPATQWKLMAVVQGRLVPLHWTERERILSDLGIHGGENHPYRIEVCLAWSELKKVLT